MPLPRRTVPRPTLSRRSVLLGSAAAGGALLLPYPADVRPAKALPPSLKLWRDPLAIPQVLTATDLHLRMVNTTHRFSSQLRAARTLAYQVVGGPAPTYLGPTIVATTGVRTTLSVTNAITSHPLGGSVDLAVHGAETEDGQIPRTAVHLHGGNTSPESDGGPIDTFPRPTHGYDQGGPHPGTYTYDNSQDAAGLWYHDHALGITRLNVQAGLAAGYLVRDTEATGIDIGDGTLLPAGPYEVPLLIQDRTFNADGSLFYDPAPWVPEFFGNTAVVNGTAFPFLDVDRGVYRFRVYNGSNARFFRLSLSEKTSGRVVPFWQIGGDGGLLNAPVAMTALLLAPGERADLLVDFGPLGAGTLVEMTNNAVTPYPSGPRSHRKGGVPLRQLVQFRVTGRAGWTPPPNVTIAGMTLRPIRPVQRLDALAATAPVRTHSLVEIFDAAGNVLMATLNNRTFDSEDFRDDPVTPNTLEVWEFANATADTHPIHLHLVQFQVLNRQAFDAVGYLARYPVDGNGLIQVNTGPYPAPPATPHLLGAPQAPAANEMGWKDTVQAPPGMVTRIAVPFGTVTGYDPDALAARRVFSGEYVWHCHILEHEDHDMMQRYLIG